MNNTHCHKLGISLAAVLCVFGSSSPAHAATLAFVQNFGSQGTGSGQFHYPSGVAVDSAGNVYVADNGKIDRFNPSDFAGTFTTYGSAGSGSGQFIYPSGVAVDSAGNVYVADEGKIDRFNPSDFGGTFTTFGYGQLGVVNGVAVDSAGNVYVADAGKIDRFDPAGTFSTFGNGLGDTTGVAVDGAGNVYVTENEVNVIAIFNPSNILAGSAGIGGGQYCCGGPSGIAVDSAGNVYVADYYNGRIVELTGAAPAPEPSTLAALALGTVSLLARRCRESGRSSL